MKIHLIDGTYELFRAHFGAPPKKIFERTRSRRNAGTRPQFVDVAPN